MGSAGLRLSGVRIRPPTASAAATSSGRSEGRRSAAVPSRRSQSSASSRSLFMRTALLGFFTPTMASTPPIAMARVSSIPEVLKTAEWPPSFPFRAADFQRLDESSDLVFYDNPRFVTHIDDNAIKALSQYYASAFPPANTPGTAILDMCSSWVSHYPKNYRQERIVGMGMNEAELKSNKVLTEYVLQDLNVDPKLPFEDNSFDVITNAVSVDYLTKPLQVFMEMNRVLKPGGLAAMSFSNRCFFTKAVSIWTSTGDADHVWIVGSYFHFAGGFEPPQALDITLKSFFGRGDPMYVVFAKKSLA